MHRAYTPKRAGRGTWIHVRRRTATCNGSTYKKVPEQEYGSTSGGVRQRAQALHPEKGRHSHVGPRTEAYSHVHRAYALKREGTSTWIQLQRRTVTCTGPTPRKVPGKARGSTFGGVRPCALGLHREKCRQSNVDPRTEAYCHVNRACTPKRAGTATWINVRMRNATCTWPTHR